MPYTALPDMRIPYDNDGTVVGQGGVYNGGTSGEATGVTNWYSGSTLTGWQSYPWGSTGGLNGGGSTFPMCTWLFFPESREVTAYVAYETRGGGDSTVDYWKGSNNSTNGLDGTWETASLPSGTSQPGTAYDWRGVIKPISFTGGKTVVRLVTSGTTNGNQQCQIAMLHVYGEKVAGQTPDDVIYINHDDTPGVEFTAAEDFGDQPLSTTVVRQFRVKNTSSTKTANTINIQCNDSEFIISEDGVNWVVTINIASLSAGAESATLYVRCTTPAPGSSIGPRFGRIVTTVASYT
jgi:hypothetical protein